MAYFTPDRLVIMLAHNRQGPRRAGSFCYRPSASMTLTTTSQLMLLNVLKALDDSGCIRSKLQPA